MFLISALAILAIFIINLMPAFMPPTWLLLSFVGFTFQLDNYSLAVLAFFAAIAATSGRALLALFSDRVIRRKFLTESIRKNTEVLKLHIEKRKAFTFVFFLIFAFSPFPSGQLFLAYGLTDLKLRLAAVPFFLGRLISYLFWAFSASEISKMMNFSAIQSGTFFSGYFFFGQLFAFYLVYLFIKIDWKILFEEHRVRFIKEIV